MLLRKSIIPKSAAFAAFALVLLAALLGCANDSGSDGVTKVTVSPETAAIALGGTQQFIAAVEGSGAFDKTVNRLRLG